jgi:hypothetical protein
MTGNYDKPYLWQICIQMVLIKIYFLVYKLIEYLYVQRAPHICNEHISVTHLMFYYGILTGYSEFLM